MMFTRQMTFSRAIALSLILLLGQVGGAAAVDLGRSLRKAVQKGQQEARDAAEAVARTATSAVPSGATTYLRQVDQALERMDRMMSEKTGNMNKNDRAQSAEAALKDAKEKLGIVESRYGAKMGKDHPELVSRRNRIASGEKAVSAFKGEMSAAIKKEDEARAGRDKKDAAEQGQQKAASEAAMSERGRRAQESARQSLEAGSAAAAGKIVFSKKPIDPAKPADLATSFKAGDLIYGLIQADKTWREIYNAKDKNEVALMIVMEVGKEQDLQYITLKKPEYIDSKHLVLEVAPDPEKMTSYKDPAIDFGEGKGARKIGPIAFTYDLGQLPAGKHKIQFYIRDFGKKHAAGELEIEGTDFKFYAGLHEKVKAASEAIGTLPPVGMVNKDLEGQMRKLLENAGWTNILRVVIVDKDWWIVDEGASRYLNVAAAAKGADGKCYWCNLQFTQPRLISGAWGALELTKTGIKRNISEENVNK